MVLDAGHIVSDTVLTIRGSLLTDKQVEFGKPADLLENEKGMLRALGGRKRRQGRVICYGGEASLGGVIAGICRRSYSAEWMGDKGC